MERSTHLILEQGVDRQRPNFFIKFTPGRTNPAVKIEDSGIGMTKYGLANNLGTIAKSSCHGGRECLRRPLHDRTVRRVSFQTKFTW